MSDKRQPWMKFYPSDWQSDPALRVCSLAARGLWAEMMAIAHQATPYGHVIVNGRPPTDAQMAILVGSTPKEVCKLTTELEGAGVFSRLDDGTIYSRRMTRDRIKAERDREFGKIGGNPKLKAQHNPTDKPPDNGGVNPPHNPKHNGGDKAQKPEARVPEKYPEQQNQASARELLLDRLAREMNLDLSGLHRRPNFVQFPSYFNQWQEAGCDAERDIWPEIRRLAGKGQPINSPRFFEPAITAARDKRLAESQKPVPPEVLADRLRVYVEHGVWPTEWGEKPSDEARLSA